jgi:hypothetical protein
MRGLGGLEAQGGRQPLHEPGCIDWLRCFDANRLPNPKRGGFRRPFGPVSTAGNCWMNLMSLTIHVASPSDTGRNFTPNFNDIRTTRLSQSCKDKTKIPGPEPPGLNDDHTRNRRDQLPHRLRRNLTQPSGADVTKADIRKGFLDVVLGDNGYFQLVAQELAQGGLTGAWKTIYQDHGFSHGSL